MALTRRGRTVLVLSTALVLAAAVAYVVGLGGAPGRVGPFAIGNAPADTGGSPPPAVCPLTGARPSDGSVPDRPALAVKVENLPAARPQAGLAWADIVYEEPVEAGITRFIAVFQCQDAGRVEPVRSARLTDADILVQFGHPLFGFAGAVPEVVSRVRASGLVDVNYDRFPHAYVRDPERPAPHNLFTSTARLYADGRTSDGIPKPLFTYAEGRGGGRLVSEVHLPFSPYSDVYWKWDRSARVWLRFHGDVPHLLSDGMQVSAENVVVQMVQLRMTDIQDVNGVTSPEVVAVGSGRAYVLRNGHMISGRWVRPHLSDRTRFLTASGHEIALTPGNTWVELLPANILLSAS